MPNNDNPRRGPSQEERRRQAVNRPLGGGGTPGQNVSRNKRRTPSRIEQISAIVTVIMLVAIVLSVLVTSCFTQTGTASAAEMAATGQPGALVASSVPVPAASYVNSRFPEREAAEVPPTASLALTTATDASKLYLGETGHYISGAFLTFWHAQGETAVFGLPLSESFNQNNHTVQLFEKALLELHPEETDPKNQVQIAFLGRQLTDARGLVFAAATITTNSTTRTFYQETGQSVAGNFKLFWDKNNGLALLGLPISNELKENGVTRQYFERGVLQTRQTTDGLVQVEVAKAGQELLEVKGWPRPTRLNVQMDIEDTEIYQGRTLALRLEPDSRWEPQDLRGSVGDEVLKLIKVDNTYRAFKSFAPWADIKAYPLKIAYTDPAGRNREFSQAVSVIKFTFKEQNLYLPDGKTDLTDKSNDDYDNAQLASTYASFSSQILWSGLWNWPTYGEITTDFGERRAYGDSTDYNLFHGGLDIAQNQGTPVAAPANGKVAYTGKLLARGNAIGLDHGAGVTSYYFHLSNILVKPGDSIKKGQIIGQVGTTGRSNGPHLHWEVRVNGVITYPLLFVNRDVSVSWPG